MTETTSRARAPSTEPRVTVAIPTYNRARLLSACLDAVFAQTWHDFEIVVSDNASTDETPAVLAGFSDQRLCVRRQAQNIGLVPNWNYCLEQATGEFIVFVSDDDVVAPSFLERVLALTVQESDVSIVSALCDVHFIDKNRVAPAKPNPRLRTGICDGADMLIEWLAEQISTPMCTTLIRTDRLRALGGFRADLQIDSDALACAHLYLTGKAGFINEPLGRVGSHSSSESSTVAFEAKFNCHREFTRRLAEMASARVADASKRLALVRESRRFAARLTLRGLASCRRGGMRLTDAIPFLRMSRGDLAALTARDMITLARPIATLALPWPVSRAIRALRVRAR